jgi:hypothetical protein
VTDARVIVSDGIAQTVCAIMLTKTKKTPLRLIIVFSANFTASVTMFAHC